MPVSIQGFCHCGQVGFELSAEPKHLVDCNCTVCRRLGALWGHVDTTHFRRLGDGKTIRYLQGDQTLSQHTCANCGCTTHWEGEGQYADRSAANFRMCEPELLARYEIRRFDGFDTWEFL